MDRLAAMSLLVTIVEEGNLSAAARRLGKPLTTVHRRIGDLEAHLGTRLLERTTRQISLTGAGADYLAACRRILDAVDEAERAVVGEYAAPRGELIVTAPIVFGRLHVVPMVAAFLARYPEIDVRLVLTDRIAHLMEEHIDVALRIGPLPDSRQIAVPVGEVRRVCCASPAYLARHGRPATPNALADHPCIAMGRPGEDQVWDFRVDGALHRQPIRARLSVTTSEGVIAAARHDAGIARALSYQVADDIATDRLSLVLEHAEPQAFPVSLVHTGQRPMPHKRRAFMDFAKPFLRERMAEQSG